MSLLLGNMKLIKTESNQATHLYKMLGVTAAQFKQAQDWYFSAQQDRKTNKTKTANKTD